MIRHDAQRHVRFPRIAVAHPRAPRKPGDQILKNIRVIGAAFPLQHHAEALKAHSRIHVVLRQSLQAPISLAIVLHEHEIPYLYNLRVILIDKVASGHARPFRIRS